MRTYTYLDDFTQEDLEDSLSDQWFESHHVALTDAVLRLRMGFDSDQELSDRTIEWCIGQLQDLICQNTKEREKEERAITERDAE